MAIFKNFEIWLIDHISDIPDARNWSDRLRPDRQSGRIYRTISVVVIFASDEKAFVLVELTGSGKHTVVGSYILSVAVVRLNGPDGVLLLSVQVLGYLAQVKVLKVERIALQMTVEASVGHQSDDYASGQLTGNNFSWLTSR